jgi:hypothetical protein
MYGSYRYEVHAYLGESISKQKHSWQSNALDEEKSKLCILVEHINGGLLSGFVGTYALRRNQESLMDGGMQ